MGRSASPRPVTALCARSGVSDAAGNAVVSQGDRRAYGTRLTIDGRHG